MMTHESTLAYRPAHALIDALREGKISSRDLLECYLERIARLNPTLNVVVAMDAENARAAADAADKARVTGQALGPLQGLPISIKDTYEVQGMPCTAGLRALRDYQPKRNAVAVQRLIDAGAIPFAKTNVPPGAADIQSDNPVYGRSNNPWDVSKTPGGSSGGAAAALAAGFTSLELGSDIGGSIRTPAHFCGVYGHKSSYSCIPSQGHVPPAPGTKSDMDLAVAGPLARSAKDLALMMEVLVAPSPNIESGYRVALPDCDKQSISDYKVLLWIDDPLCPIDSSLRDQYLALKTRLEQAGAHVDIASPSGLCLDDLFPCYVNLLGSVLGAIAPAPLRLFMGMSAPFLALVNGRFNTPRHFQHYLRGAAQSHAKWLAMHEEQLKLREHFCKTFDQYDVVLSPITPTQAFTHNAFPALPMRRIVVDGKHRNYTSLFHWIAPATLLGLPATSAPIGSANGLPINIQIIANHFADNTSIDFAARLEDLLGKFTPPVLP